MRFLKLLLNVGLIVNVLQTDAKNNINKKEKKNIEEDDSFSLFNHSEENFIDPLEYNLELTLHPDINLPTVTGKSEIRIMLNRTIRNININVYKLDIRKNVILVQEDEGQSQQYPVHNYIDYKFKQILILYFAEDIKPGYYILHMQYEIPTDLEKGLVRTKYINKNGTTTWLFTTKLKPSMARRVFPCWDEQPELIKSIFNISIKHPRHYTALSNMPIRKHINTEQNMKWTYFFITQKIPATQVAIALFEQFIMMHSIDTVTNVWCRPQAVFKLVYAHNIATKIAQHIHSFYSSIPRIISKTDHVAIPSYFHEATVRWGLIIFREEYLKYHEMYNLADRKLDVSTIVASQMAQQRFDDLVNPSSWIHLKLHYGLTNILGLNILSKVYDNPQMIPLIFYQIQQQARDYKYLSHTIRTFRKIKNTNDIFNIKFPQCCLKESVLMRMLESIITEDVLNNGLIKYFQKHSYNSSTIDDLWATLQEALDESTIPHRDYNIKEIMDTWITQDYYPVVTVTRNYETGDVVIIQKSAYDKENIELLSSKWWIPLNFLTQQDPNIVRSMPLWIRPIDSNVTTDVISRFGWIIINAQYTGYYRVNYDRENWLRIAHYLNTENFEIIPELSRAHMIDDAYYFLKKGLIDSDIFFKLTEYLKRETSYVPWFALKHILLELWHIFKLPEAEYLQNHLVNISEGVLQRIKYEDQDIEEETIKLIRFFATDLACRLGSTVCRKWAKDKLEAFVNHTITFTPWWTKWTYCNGMRDANMLTWSSMLNKHLSTQVKKILECLTYSEDTDIIIYYLNLISSKAAQKRFHNMELNNKEHNTILLSIIKKHATNSLVLNHILINFDGIINTRSPATVIIDIIKNLYTTNQFDKVMEFTNTMNISTDDLHEIEDNMQERRAHITKMKLLAELFKEENR